MRFVDDANKGWVDFESPFFLKVKVWGQYDSEHDMYEITAWTHAPGEDFRVRADWTVSRLEFESMDEQTFALSTGGYLFEAIDAQYLFRETGKVS